MRLKVDYRFIMDLLKDEAITVLIDIAVTPQECPTEGTL